MTRRVGWLLTEIERQADGRMSDLARCELVAEVAGHLDAAIQARMELGIDADEAEKQAIKEFGHPKAYVKDLLKVHRPAPSTAIWKGDQAVMTVFWVGASAGMLFALSAPKQFVPGYFFGGVAIALIALSIASFKSRCARPLPLAKASVVMYLFTALGLTLTWHNLWIHGGMGVMPDWVASEYSDHSAATLATLDADYQLLRKGVELHKMHKLGGQPVTLSPDENSLLMTAPVLDSHFASTLYSGYVDPSDDVLIGLRPVQTIAQADQEWQYSGRNYLNKLDAAEDRYRETVNAIEAARSSWILADLPRNLLDALAMIPFLFLPCAFFNMIFGWLGWLAGNYRIIRRRRA